MSEASRPIRVLYVQPADAFGGAERQAVTVIPLLSAHGIDVVPLVGPGRTIVDWLHARGVRDVVFSGDFPENLPIARGMRYLGVPFRYARLRTRIDRIVARLIREERIDVVYAALPFAWASTTAAARRLHVPIVWRAGGPRLYGGGFGHALFAPWARRHPPDLVICSSEAVRATFAPMIPAAMAVVLNGVDLDEFQPAREPLRRDTTSAAPCIGFAARLVASKGIRDLLIVAARLATAMPEVRVLIAGDGPRRGEFERHAAALGADRNTRFLGYVADMRAFYAACDIVVLPSRFEGCPNVVLEAMAMGCAVIATPLPAVREIVGDGATAKLVAPADVDGLHAAISDLCRNSATRRELGRAGLSRVRARFDARVSAARVAELLHGVARRHRQRAAVAANQSDCRTDGAARIRSAG
jgi:glycosyltransferase involved in cell wall biosynthesis